MIEYKHIKIIRGNGGWFVLNTLEGILAYGTVEDCIEAIDAWLGGE